MVPVVCGDGLRQGDEECDDHNVDPHDGCDAECHVEPSFVFQRRDEKGTDKCRTGSVTEVLQDPSILAGTTVVFTPQKDEEDLYTVCASTISVLPGAPGLSAAFIPLHDEQAPQIKLPFPFPFAGLPRHLAFVSNNGFLTFEPPSTECPSLQTHFARARLSVFFADMVPSGVYSLRHLVSVDA